MCFNCLINIYSNTQFIEADTHDLQYTHGRYGPYVQARVQRPLDMQLA